jgi:uncharacterized membrane-anchored protein YhcB (DUF1043 family)
LIETYIYIGVAFIAGFITAWIIRSVTLNKLNKLQRSTQGYLESEKLMKETIQKENIMAHQMKQAVELEYGKKLQESQAVIRMLDENILLLQKSNEETEALLKAGLPAMHDLKLKLIEANNTIARYKGQVENK